MNDRQTHINSYLHLNSSFSNHLGLSHGKAAVVLYFATLDDDYYRNEISYSILGEILGQIHKGTPLTFGTGVSGIGVLLTYLNNRGILGEDEGDLLAEVEPILINFLEKIIYEVNLSSGACGLGRYFLFRIKNHKHSVKHKFFPLYKDCIQNTVNLINDRLIAIGNLKTTAPLFPIWHGLPGIYLFLQEVSRTDLFGPSIMELVQRMGKIISHWLYQTSPCWEMVSAYFALSNDFSSDRIWLDSFKHFLNIMPQEPVDFYDAAFHALLLKIIAGQHQIKEAAQLSGSLKYFVNQTLSIRGLKNMFPFDIKEDCVPVGLERGICGTALPLLSLESGDYGWLSLLGVELEGKLMKQ